MEIGRRLRSWVRVFLPAEPAGLPLCLTRINLYLTLNTKQERIVHNAQARQKVGVTLDHIIDQ